ncbi:MAG TPA: ABC transporter permease, partial [Gemmatimonadales bacterium]|nr:ABC transporter permease [Gemmatimonadales bacterium]
MPDSALRDAETRTAPTVEVRRGGAAIELVLAGDWVIGATPQGVTEADAAVAGLASGGRVTYRAEGLGPWDSALIVFLVRIGATAREALVTVEPDGLPGGAQRLLALAEAVPEREDMREDSDSVDHLEQVGRAGLSAWDRSLSLVEFVGEVALSLGRFVAGRAQVRGRDIALAIQQAGAQALGVVALTNFLLGLILAFVGAAQLEQFGATMYVADLVGIGVVRDLAAIMTAIVLSGRSGAAYAAAIGTMQTSQEIDALRVNGIDPVDALVLPRVMALVLMTPLLTLYANLFGVFGGSFVASAMFDISPRQFYNQVRTAVPLKFLLGGLFKATVYGALVALAGCWHGMRCGRSAAAVGKATTSAVVLGIVLIIAAAGVFAYVFNVL